MFKIWTKSQAFIYHKAPHKLQTTYPDCFGNFINEYYVLSLASCFMEIEELLKLLPTDPRIANLHDFFDIGDEEIIQKVFRGHDLKEYIIVQVNRK